MSEDTGESPAEGPEESQEAESETSEHYSHDSDSSGYKGTEEYKADSTSSEKSEKSSQEDKDSLEAKLDNKETEEGKEINLVEYLKSKGLSSEKIEEALEAKETYSVENAPKGVRSIIYLIKGFLENPKEEDVYKKIEESDGTPVLFLPGLLNFPYGVSQIEEHTGLNVIRVDTRDPEEIRNIIHHAYLVSGQKPVLAGYSDGGKTITNAVEAIGSDIRDYVSEIFFISANKEPETMPGIVYIDGANDKLASTEKGYHKGIDQGSIKIEIPDAGHLDLVYNPRTIQQIGDIIMSYTHVRKDFLPAIVSKAA